MTRIGSDGTLDGVALEVTVDAGGFKAGHRFTNWYDVPEGVPVRAVEIAREPPRAVEETPPL